MRIKIAEKSKEARDLVDQIERIRRVPTYFHVQVALLEKILQFQESCGVRPE